MKIRSLRDIEAYVLFRCNKTPGYLKKASDRLKNNKKFILKLQERHSLYAAVMGENLLVDRDFWRVLISHDIYTICDYVDYTGQKINDIDIFSAIFDSKKTMNENIFKRIKKCIEDDFIQSENEAFCVAINYYCSYVFIPDDYYAFMATFKLKVKDKETARQIVFKTPNSYDRTLSTFDYKLCNDNDFLISLVREKMKEGNPYWLCKSILKYSDSVKKSKEFAMISLFWLDIEGMEKFSPEIKDDKKIAVEAVKTNNLLYCCLSDRLKYDTDIIKAIIDRQNGFIPEILDLYCPYNHRQIIELMLQK